MCVFEKDIDFGLYFRLYEMINIVFKSLSENFTITLKNCAYTFDINLYKPGVLFMGHRQTS